MKRAGETTTTSLKLKIIKIKINSADESLFYLMSYLASTATFEDINIICVNIGAFSVM